MKRIISISLSCFVAGIANAIPLFPFFVDVAGDYREGTPSELAAMDMPCMYWRHSPIFYKDIKSADEFLNDVMPYSTESISREIVDRDNVKAIRYTSPMVDGKTSVIYMVEIPEAGFFVGYNEL